MTPTFGEKHAARPRRSPAGNARHADPADAALRPATRPRDWCCDSRQLRGRAEHRPRIAVPGAPPARETGPDRCTVEAHGEQAAREILPPDTGRPATSRGGADALECADAGDRACAGSRLRSRFYDVASMDCATAGLLPARPGRPRPRGRATLPYRTGDRAADGPRRGTRGGRACGAPAIKLIDGLPRTASCRASQHDSYNSRGSDWGRHMLYGVGFSRLYQSCKWRWGIEPLGARARLFMNGSEDRDRVTMCGRLKHARDTLDVRAAHRGPGAFVRHGRVRANHAEACTEACTKGCTEAHREHDPARHRTRAERSICWRVAVER